MIKNTWQKLLKHAFKITFNLNNCIIITYRKFPNKLKNFKALLSFFLNINQHRLVGQPCGNANMM